MSETPNLQGVRASLNAQLKQEALNQQVTVNFVRKQYIFTVFMRRVFNPEDSSWTLLGGNALLIRTGAGRYTKDLDLARRESFESEADVVQALHELTTRSVSEDPFRFSVERVVMQKGRSDEYGYGTPAAKGTIVAYLGAQEFERFTVDIVPQRRGQWPVDRLPMWPIIEHETLKNLPEASVVPLENHLADKICAMYEIHGNSPSTRLRDLADIVRIVLQLPFRASILKDKLLHESKRRQMDLPTVLESPAPAWRVSFPKAATTYAGYPEELHSLEASLDLAGQCLNQILSGERIEGDWNPETQEWK